MSTFNGAVSRQHLDCPKLTYLQISPMLAMQWWQKFDATATMVVIEHLLVKQLVCGCLTSFMWRQI